jgi:hypothetical protein
MNNKSIKKHFHNAWKDRLFIARTSDDRIWLSDINCLISVRESDPVMESRVVIPKIPASGESFLERRDSFTTEKGPDIEGLINKTVDENHEQLTVTGWFRFIGPEYARLFKNNDQKIFINEKYLDLIVGPEEQIEDYEFYGTGPMNAVLVVYGGDLVAILMPCKVETDGDI